MPARLTEYFHARKHENHRDVFLGAQKSQAYENGRTVNTGQISVKLHQNIRAKLFQLLALS